VLAVSAVVVDSRAGCAASRVGALLNSHWRVFWTRRNRLGRGLVRLHRCRRPTTRDSEALASDYCYLRSRCFPGLSTLLVPATTQAGHAIPAVHVIRQEMSDMFQEALIKLIISLFAFSPRSAAIA